jgi:hypothetical protein
MLLESRKKGLLQYRKYLLEQLDFGSKSTLRKCYEEYVEEQVQANERRLMGIQLKINAIR